VNLQLDTRAEVFEEESFGVDIKRTHTCLYAVATEDDYAWMMMNLGKIQPSTEIGHTVDRGWCFLWHNSTSVP